MAWMHVQLSSAQVRMPVHAEILLPQSVIEERKEGDRIPVLYLLHDRAGDHTQWLRKAALETFQEEAPMAIVMPSGNASWFVNLKYGKNYQNYIKEELPALCEQLFPVSDKRESRYLAGVGMGGYGALNIALSKDCPFGAVGAFQADIDIKKYYQTAADKEEMENIFGSQQEYEASSNCLIKAAGDISGQELPDITMMCTGDTAILRENRELYSALKARTDRVELREENAVSGWNYFGECLRSFMKERI